MVFPDAALYGAPAGVEGPQAWPTRRQAPHPVGLGRVSEVPGADSKGCNNALTEHVVALEVAARCEKGAGVDIQQEVDVVDRLHAVLEVCVRTRGVLGG